jgi:phage regulator Rha-like protein
MNQLTQKTLVVTSKDLSEMVESRHDNVKRVIKTLAEQGIIEFPQIEEIQTATKPVSVYIFTEANKRDSYVVVAQLSPPFTARLVDRW